MVSAPPLLYFHANWRDPLEVPTVRERRQDHPVRILFRAGDVHLQ